MWDTKDWHCISEMKHPSEAWNLALVDSTGEVVVSCGDKQAYVWSHEASQAVAAPVWEAFQARVEEAPGSGGAVQSATQAALRRKVQKKKKGKDGEGEKKEEMSAEEKEKAEAKALAAQAVLLAELELEETPSESKGEGKKKKKKKR